jgi:hypothetical protein
MIKCILSYIFRYFFLVFTVLIILGVFNGLVFLPVLLVLVGPPGEFIPNDNATSIAPPSPDVTTCSRRHLRSSSNNQQNQQKPMRISSNNLHNAQKHHSDLSLSTIAEESGSYASSSAHDAFPMTSQSLNGASVFVEPHVTIETTTYPATGHVSYHYYNFVEIIKSGDWDPWRVL